MKDQSILVESGDWHCSDGATEYHPENGGLTIGISLRVPLFEMIFVIDCKIVAKLLRMFENHEASAWLK